MALPIPFSLRMALCDLPLPPWDQGIDGSQSVAATGPMGTSTPTVTLTWSSRRDKIPGVPVVMQWLTNPTRNHVGLVPGLAQWVKDPALP